MDDDLVEAAKETAKQILSGEYKCQKGGAYAAQALALGILRHDAELRRRAEARAYVEGEGFTANPHPSQNMRHLYDLTDEQLLELQREALGEQDQASRWQEEGQ